MREKEQPELRMSLSHLNIFRWPAVICPAGGHSHYSHGVRAFFAEITIVNRFKSLSVLPVTSSFRRLAARNAPARPRQSEFFT
jgi:hypothetical protein